jgi:DNA invertase Pin-like site-specific DNA recombinase
MPVYGYTRVSTAEQTDGTSLAEQARRIQGVALMKDLESARVFEEPGVSGSIPLEERPVGRELLAALRPGDTLVVAKLDRAFRNAADALTKADSWKRQGIKLIVADMGAEPVTDNGVAKMFFGMLALVAEFERGRILERTLEGRRAKAAKGGHIGGSAPFGYRVEGTGKEARLVEVPEQQAALTTIRELCRQVSLRKIAAVVEEQHSFRLSHEAVRRVCKHLAREKVS